MSYTAISRLITMHVPPQKAGILASGIAAVGFMAVSAGSALTLLGHHLFDEIEVSARWRGRPDLNVSLRQKAASKWTFRNRPCWS